MDQSIQLFESNCYAILESAIRAVTHPCMEYRLAMESLASRSEDLGSVLSDIFVEISVS